MVSPIEQPGYRTRVSEKLGFKTEADILGDDICVALPYEEPGFTYYGIVYKITVDELRKLS